MTSKKIRKKFFDFFEKKGHKIVPSSSLIPDDPSVLLTTAGMQQFKRYYTGELNAVVDFGTKNTASIQKCFRTSDIDEVGDESHLTFFEMLGNFSFGGYFKKESIKYGHEFITKIMNLPVEYVTVFDPEKVSQGDWRKGVPFDKESYDIWKSILPKEKIKREGMDNFWGPTGSEGPCGPTTEIYINAGGKPVEIWNIVFNEFHRDSNNNLKKLETSGVDTGMGLERLAMVSQNVSTIFETDLFNSLIKILPITMPERTKRIFADHMRGVCFLISDGVRPSNKEAGYVLRRLLRRVLVHEYLVIASKDVKLAENGAETFLIELVKKIIDEYGIFYSKSGLNFNKIYPVLAEETKKFHSTMKMGLKELAKLTRDAFNAKSAFRLYESYGLPFEVIKEIDINKAKNLTREDFDKEFKKHQEISRAGAEKKFGGHGLILDTGELKAGNDKEMKKVICFHTATHLLQWALREVSGKDIKQTGSDINPERMRFDFSFSRKMKSEEIGKVENLVNQKIQENLPVYFKEMPKMEAEKIGALSFFKAKYPDVVKVYFIGPEEKVVSAEFCGGPHVNWTSEIGKFKILKEEAVSAGVRRIRAII